jgi:hypothetical protein
MAVIIAQRGGRATAWKIGGAGTVLPGAMSLLAYGFECARATVIARESPWCVARAWPARNFGRVMARAALA